MRGLGIKGIYMLKDKSNMHKHYTLVEKLFFPWFKEFANKFGVGVIVHVYSNLTNY